MGEQQPRLDSWKEIAVYLNRGVRTVRRWEKEEGLPVHRHAHNKLGTVFAHRAELDQWREGRRTPPREPAPSNATAPRRMMIAVLPFVDLVPAGDADYIADGLTEEMIGHLGRFSPGRLGVIARTTVMTYRRSDRPVREIAAELKVDYLVEGTIRREGDRLRVTAHLIEAAGQTHVWSNTYEQTIDSLLALQRDLARDIASGIQVTLAPRHAAALVPDAPLTADAYHAHLEGRHRLNSLTPDSIRRSVEIFQRAIAADPGYAPPHASLAEACVMLSVWTEAPPSHAFPMALEAAEYALRLDPALPDAHASLGLINAYYLWDWREAEQRFRTALELNPSCSPAGAWYGEFLAVLGRVDEALSVIDAALRHDPLSRPIRAMRAFALWLGRRFDEAIEAAESVLDLDPAYPMALIRLGVAHAGLGEYAAAVRAFRRAAAAAPDLPACIGLLGYAHGLAGDVREAQAALGKLHRLTGSRYVPAYPFAMVHLGLGELDTAVQFIEQEFENRGWFVLLLNKAPHLDPLRGQARFDTLVRRMQFPA